ncbi:hypothetical protein C7E12_21950, partial [Stenotrophomonas maltophilia]
PLTFADLHDAPRYAGEPDSPHAISLQMITTCVCMNACSRLSGKPLDAPLTFADLHDAPRYAGEPDSPHAISLQMITTCV